MAHNNRDTVRVSLESIMYSEAFRQGVADVRARQAPRFGRWGEDDFCYEQGRQFAVLAPRGLQVVLETRQLNPKAVRFFKRHKKDFR